MGLKGRFRCISESFRGIESFQKRIRDVSNVFSKLRGFQESQRCSGTSRFTGVSTDFQGHLRDDTGDRRGIQGSSGSLWGYRGSHGALGF